MRSFPFGSAALSIFILAVLSGTWLAITPPVQNPSTLRLWVFAKVHYDTYQKAIPAFEAANPGVKVDLQLVANSSLASRLQSAFLANVDVPDLVEIEISSAGSFFRGPLNEVGFLDLTDRIHRAGLYDRMVKARFAPYTKNGHIFGLPHDVHPVMLAYRRDIFEQEGIDVNKIKTWDDFIAVGHKITIPGKRYLMEMSDSGGDQFEVCLFQRGGGYFDANGNCIFDNETAVQTMLWYVPLVAGPNKIGGDLGSGQILTKAVEDGYLLSLAAPDWRSKSIETDIPRMAGKMALMPLPAVNPGGIRTSTWGGTMMGITRHSPHPDLAWKLAQFLYLNKPDLAERFRNTNILPCLREAWNQPSFQEPRPYWSNQPLGSLYAALAPDVPAQRSSPFIGLAKGKLSAALVDCVERYKASGGAGFESFVRAKLHQNAEEVRIRIRRNPY